MSHSFLFHRGIIRISGADKFTFLQGLITQELRLLSPERMLYACLLTPQGKYLADFFITQSGEDWLIDIDRSLLPDVIKRLTLFKLRSRVVLTDMSEHYAVHAFWHDKPDIDLIYDDPRAPDVGWRLVAEKGTALPGGEDDYVVWQLQNGLPDVGDFQRERTAMLEANMDLLHALSWEKGCYMGQELTARTHYRGLIKKRFLPVMFDREVSIAPDTPVEKNGKTIGYTRSQKGGYALAMMQLESLADGDSLFIADHKAQVFFPEWFKL